LSFPKLAQSALGTQPLRLKLRFPACADSGFDGISFNQAAVRITALQFSGHSKPGRCRFFSERETSRQNPFDNALCRGIVSGMRSPRLKAFPPRWAAGRHSVVMLLIIVNVAFFLAQTLTDVLAPGLVERW